MWVHKDDQTAQTGFRATARTILVERGGYPQTSLSCTDHQVLIPPVEPTTELNF
jgi:hypothetical protein